MKKRLISLLMTLTLCLSLLPAAAVPAGAKDGTWSGSGTENAPYLIEDAADLKALAGSVNAGVSYQNTWFRLAKDIDLGGAAWTPIGNGGNAFSGVFLGGGHRITGLKVERSDDDCVGLFCHFGSGGRVEDLTVSGDVNGKEYVGGIAGKNEGTIKGCVFTGSVTGKKYVGGITGESTGTLIGCLNKGTVSASVELIGGIAGAAVNIDSCTNQGEINGSNASGGIVGYLGGSVTNCFNSGKINSGWYSFIGGIAGIVKGSSVTNCTNQGEINGGASTGGLLGECDNACTVSNCVNSGAVIVFGSSARGIGGIAGTFGNGTITNCLNTGAVTVESKSSELKAGGILGTHFSDNTEATVKNCTNRGAISGVCTGGIVGGGSSLLKVSNCVNEGTVCGKANVGGISGASGILSTCLNKGKVTGTDYYVGGIAGFMPKNRSVDLCKNTGAVSGGKEVGGLVGESKGNLIMRSINTGSVEGESYVGGILGALWDGSTSTVWQCRNEGTVTAKGNNAGGIAGDGEYEKLVIRKCGNTGAVEAGGENAGGIAGIGNAGITIEDCYDLGSVSGSVYVGGVLGMARNTVEVARCYTKAPEDGIVCTGDDIPGALIGARAEGAEYTLERDYWWTDCAAHALGWYHEYNLQWHSGEDWDYIYYQSSFGKEGTFEGWDFEDDWYIDSNAEVPVPRLQWEKTLSITPSGCTESGIGGIGAPVQYYDPLEETELTRDSYITVTADTTTLTDGWYAVTSDVTISGRMEIKGKVNLILCDGATLTAEKGVHLVPLVMSDAVGTGLPSSIPCSLTVWGQTGSSGVLYAGTSASPAPDDCAGIGGNKNQNGGGFTLNGGKVYAYGGNYGAGVGGGDTGSGGGVTVNGGVLEAYGRNGSAGIGGGDGGDGGTLTVNGGTVKAVGSTHSQTGRAAAGIGAGRPKAVSINDHTKSGICIINGGTVIAQAGTPTGTGLGAQAIGVNQADWSATGVQNLGKLDIAPGMKVTAGSSESVASAVSSENRVDACRLNPWAKIEPCTTHDYDGNVCKWCGFKRDMDYVNAKGEAMDPIPADQWRAVESDTTTLTEGWWAVTEDVLVLLRMTISGEVNIILCDGAELKMYEGIEVSGDASLTIWGQGEPYSVPETAVQTLGTGKLTITGEKVHLLPGDNSVLEAAGIGSSGYQKDAGAITVNGGVLSVQGGKNSAGIGSGNHGDVSKNITINGGCVTASGGQNGAGIGGGNCGDVTNSRITITGGYVKADGGEHGAGIGGGDWGRIRTDTDADVTISGGVVKATGGESAAGIGGGEYGTGGTVTIDGGEVTAKGGRFGAGVGGGDSGDGGALTVNGGVLEARGRDGSAGIGGGDYGNGGTVTVNGGTVKAFGSTRSEGNNATGQAAPGIGAGRPKTNGEEPRSSGICTVNGGVVIAQAGTPQMGAQGAQAIGVNLADKDKNDNNKADKLVIAGGVKVTAGSSESASSAVLSAGRVTACRENPWAKLETCSPHVYDSGSTTCKYCGGVTYWDPLDGTEKTCGTFQTVENSTNTVTWTDGWYVVSGKKEINDHVEIKGNVNLILCDGAALTVEEGIYLPDTSSLTVWGQSAGSGKLTARSGGEDDAGIGGSSYGGKNGGPLTVNGGSLDVTGSQNGAGIGGGKGGGFVGGVVTVNGGTITVTSPGSGQAIGKGEGGTSSGTLTLGNAEKGIWYRVGTRSLNSNDEWTWAAPDERVETCRGTSIQVRVEPCEHDYENGACRYCGLKQAGVTYFDPMENGEKTQYGFTEAESSGETVTWTGGWYAVDGAVEISSILVQGHVNLVLRDKAALTVPEGIRLSDSEAYSLTVWGQSAGTGKLIVSSADADSAGVGGGTDANGGRLTVNGGALEVTGGLYSAGVGGGKGGSGGNVTVNGGKLTVKGGAEALGCGRDGAKSGDLVLGNAEEGIWYKAGTKSGDVVVPALLSDREDTCRMQSITVCVEPCAEHTYEKGACKWCGAPDPVTYEVSVDGGKADKSPAVYAQGVTVTVTADAAPSGQVFEKWTGEGVTFDSAYSNKTTFEMPDHAVTVKANYQAAYAVTVDGGTADKSPAVYAQGEEVVVEADAAASGQVFDKWTCDCEDVTFDFPSRSQASFKMPAQAVTVKANYKNTTAPTYTLSVTAPAFDGVKAGYAQPEAKAITITSTGNSAATITSVALSGTNEDSFTLNKTDGATIAAGATDSTTYTVRPNANLGVGTYAATITVTYNNNATATADVSFTVSARDVVAAPTFDPAGGSYIGTKTVTISCATAGATIYYTTNGDDPTTASTKYSTPITVSENTTIKAMAVKEEMDNSGVASAEYTITAPTYTLSVAAPAFDGVKVGYAQPEAKAITITSTGNSAATISSVALSGTNADSFTLNKTDGTTIAAGATDSTTYTVRPSANLGVGSYTATITVTYNNNATATADVSFTVSTRDVVATPTFDPAGGSYIGTKSVTISCATEGATIYYTTNGDDPTTASTKYSTPITVSENTTIKAMAAKEEMDNSAIATAEYTITVPTYTLSVTAPTFDGVKAGYAQPEAKAITITSTGNSAATISSVALSGTNADSFTLTEGNQTVAAGGTNTTYTVQPNADLGVGSYTATITVTYNNNATATADVSFTVSTRDVAATPTFDPAGGSYIGTKSVTISCATEGATIYYTTDGSDPSTSSTPYTGAISVPQSTIIKAIAAKDGMDNSATASATYTIQSGSHNGSGGGSGASYRAINITASAHGTVKLDPANPRAGVLVTATLLPDAGYRAAGLTVTDAKGNAVPLTKTDEVTYTFTMPDTTVTVTPAFAAVTEPDNPDNSGGGDVSDCFTDVPRDAWYHDAVQWAVDKGLMNGVSDTLFAPNDTATRAMVVTMLWRLAGEPMVNDLMPYTDVPQDVWYTEAVRWAASAGAVNGTSETTFSPDTPVTREQLAAILYRYAQAQGKGFEGMWAFPLDYSDAADVFDYAYEALCWMTMHGVINGMGDGTLAPGANATRAQIATMFMRFCEELEK